MKTTTTSSITTRILNYLSVMFPPLHALGGPILAMTYFAAIFQLAGTSAGHVSGEISNLQWPPLLIGGISLSLFTLMIRVMDEFKDYEDDLRNFPHRPLPSGQVFKTDLKILQTVIFAALIFINSFYPMLMMGTLIIMIYSTLMYKWFFMEKRMRQSLPLAFLSHHPIVYFYYAYLLLCAQEAQIQLTTSSLLMMIPLAFTSTNWELSRKIRAPHEETHYTTYSKIWGLQRSILAALFCQGVTLVGILWYLGQVQAPFWYSLAILVLYLMASSPYVVFLKNKSLSKPLKIYAEGLTIITFLAIIGHYTLTRVNLS